MEQQTDPELIVVARAILALMVERRAESESKLGPVEYLLADAGLSTQDIASLVGKKTNAVRMMLSRRKDT